MEVFSIKSDQKNSQSRERDTYRGTTNIKKKKVDKVRT